MPSRFFGDAGQYLSSVGIDPDMPLTDDADDLKTGGMIRPVNYEKFSGAEVDASPIAILTTPKTTGFFVVLANGKLLKYNSDYTFDSLLGTTSENTARGALYYNNYISIMTGTDISTWGPLNDTPAFVNNQWTAGLYGTQQMLTDGTFPVTLFGVGYLNHFGVTHADDAAYFLDFVDGIGYVHKLKTEKDVFEGDTNAGSLYGVLDLPYNFIPLTISSYGNDLVISGSFTTDSVINQGPTSLFFWDTTADSFYRAVPLPGTICTILKYINGKLFLIVGDIAGGYRFCQYVGGDAVDTLAIIEDSFPPIQTASDYVGNRVVWGANITYPMVASGLFAWGSKSDLFQRGLHMIAVSALTDPT